jgi:hypothetical protein
MDTIVPQGQKTTSTSRAPQAPTPVSVDSPKAVTVPHALQALTANNTKSLSHNNAQLALMVMYQTCSLRIIVWIK